MVPMQITIRQKKSILAAHLSERGRKGHCTPHIDLSAVFGQWNDVLIPIQYTKCQFGCGILKMVGPKKQKFWPRINILEGIFIFQICQ